MSTETDEQKVRRFELALEQVKERFEEDRYVLAAVLVGSLSLETIWRRDSISMWIIEADGVSRRLRSDGKDERIYRILVEDEINIHAEIIPRTRFKQMVEGSSRTAFSCNYFAQRELIYCKDASIEQWFTQALSVATKDKERELLTFSTWTIYAIRQACKLFEIRGDLQLAVQQVLSAAHSLAYTEIIRAGQVWEQEVIYKAMESSPDLFQAVYLDVLSKPRNKKVIAFAIETIEDYLSEHYQEHLKPLLSLLRKENRVIPLSEISDYFAFSQVYPWHLEAACEWLHRHGHLEKLSAAFKLTSRSQVSVEEPAYFMDH
ncbi:MAG: hypothetical protein KDB22_27105 [Planctomycetales bacterium]|nr:hypothetical protein [Planctomycetales bacterium]